MFEQLDAQLDRLAIGSLTDDRVPRERFYHETALDRARRTLKWDSDISSQALFETRIRLALHLAPRSAICYERSNPRPRWKLIFTHLVSTLGRDPSGAEALAREIALVLDSWDSERSLVTGHLNYLMSRDGPQCRNCKVSFVSDPVSLRNKDVYKPFFLAPDELLRPEVDHIEAISALGTNVLSNLQILCRLCNAGKGAGLGLDVREEIKYAGRMVESAPRSHRCKLVYYVIARDDRRCQQCGDDSDELTIRPIVMSGGLLRSNLRTVCVRCLANR